MKKELPKITVINAFSFVVFLITIIFISICFNKYNEPNITPDIKNTNFTGTYTINNDNLTYTIPENHKLKLEGIKRIDINLKFDEKIEKSTDIFLFVEQADIRILKNQKEIFTYNNDDNYDNITKAIGSKWISFESPGIKKYDNISIILTTDSENISEKYLENFLVNISQGNRYSLLKNQIEKNIGKIITSALTFVIGFVLLVVLIAFKLMRSPIEIGSLSCALLIISGGIASFINYDYITLIFPNDTLVNIIYYLNLLLLMLFILFHIRIYLHNKIISKTINFFIYIWTIIIIGYYIYQIFNFIELITLTDYVIKIATIILIFLVIFLIIEHKECKGTRITLYFTIGLIVTMLIEMYFKTNHKEFIYTPFRIGILIFAIVHFMSIIFKAQNSFVRAARADKIENELIQSKISVMLSQIQPHFLYNTLVVIRQLCDINPKTAKEAVTEFATYLRGNLDSLTLNNTIPFEKEMEHIENYVSLEKKRFGDRINIEYDFECMDFEVPSLTIQTIVENAIRHGITKRKEGGTVTIRTRETKKRYVIEVIDNGVGMDLTKPPEYSDNRSHIGLENVRKRVESMCNGELLFNSTPSIGTTVYMSIPKPEEDIKENKKQYKEKRL